MALVIVSTSDKGTISKYEREVKVREDKRERIFKIYPFFLIFLLTRIMD